jgi:hypothetical protein
METKTTVVIQEPTVVIQEPTVVIQEPTVVIQELTYRQFRDETREPGLSVASICTVRSGSDRNEAEIQASDEINGDEINGDEINGDGINGDGTNGDEINGEVKI